MCICLYHISRCNIPDIIRYINLFPILIFYLIVYFYFPNVIMLFISLSGLFIYSVRIAYFPYVRILPIFISCAFSLCRILRAFCLFYLFPPFPLSRLVSLVCPFSLYSLDFHISPFPYCPIPLFTLFSPYLSILAILSI